MVDYEAEDRERLETQRDDQQLSQAISLQESNLQTEDAKLKWKMVEHKPRGHQHDNYFDELLRLSNLDGPANMRLRSYYFGLMKCSDFGPRAARWTDLLWDLIRAESDVYAATGPGRERVMQNTMRSELVRNQQDGQQRGGGIMGSLSEMARGRR